MKVSEEFAGSDDALATGTCRQQVRLKQWLYQAFFPCTDPWYSGSVMVPF
jgi:hypothetical protein